MRIDVRARGRIVVITPKGRLTVETEEHFSDTVRRLVDAGHTRLVLNMADISAMDCRGLGAIAQACVAARECGGDLKLLNLTPRSRHMLTVTKLLTALSTYDSEAEAERSFRLDLASIATDDLKDCASHHRRSSLRGLVTGMAMIAFATLIKVFAA